MKMVPTNRTDEKSLRPMQRGAGADSLPLHSTVTAGNAAPGGNGERFLQTTYKDGKLAKVEVPWEQAQALDPRDFDLYLDLVRMIVSVRKRDGAFIRHEGTIKGVGPVVLLVLLKVLRFPGRYLRRYEIGRQDPQIDSHYVAECIVQDVARLRKHLFGEDGGSASFLLTKKPLAVAFNRELSFCVLQRIVLADEEDAQADVTAYRQPSNHKTENHK